MCIFRCAKTAHRNVIKTFTKDPSTKAITFEFKAFKLVKKDNIFAEITFNVCPAAACADLPVCKLDTLCSILLLLKLLRIVLQNVCWTWVLVKPQVVHVHPTPTKPLNVLNAVHV